MRYDVWGRRLRPHDMEYVESHVGRAGAVEAVDDLVEKEHWWAGAVVTEKNQTTYYRSQEPTYVTHPDGDVLPVHKGRTLLRMNKAGEQNTWRFRTDAEMHQTKAFGLIQGWVIEYCLGIREVEELIRNEMEIFVPF